MNIAERFSQLDAREQRILNFVGIGLAVIVLFVVPIALTAVEHGKRSENQALKDAADLLADNREQIERAKTEKAATLQRYSKPAPPLATLLAGFATQAGVEIPESQDRQAIPHGKKYSERSTKVALHKVGMFKLLKFLELVEQTDSPVTISALNIRKRGPDPDSYDVDMTVSAFDRTAAPDKPARKADADTEEAKP